MVILFIFTQLFFYIKFFTLFLHKINIKITLEVYNIHWEIIEGGVYMVYGIIDLGSNTIRLSIFKYEDGKIRLLQNKKAIAGLAACVEGGGLTEIGISKACFV